MMQASTPNPFRVRVALPPDEDGLVDLCKSLHEENGLLSMCEDKVRAVIRVALSGQDYSVIGIVEGQKIDGAIFLKLSQEWYTTDWCLAEMFNYVRPEARASSAAKDLIAFAKHTSDRLQVPLQIGIVSNTRTIAKIRLYSKHIGPPSGAFFLYRGRTGQHAGVN